MARNDFDTWVPEEYDSDVLVRVRQTSGIERFARVETMGTDTKHVPRSAGMGVGVVPKGSPYTEDTSLNDDVVLIARKFGKVLRVAEEDLDDTPENIIRVKQLDWATSYAKAFDNACLATTGAANGTTVPFTSVYAALSAADPDMGYTAGANIVTSVDNSGASPVARAVNYDDLSDTLSKYEVGDYFDPSNTVIIAHPAFRAALRQIKDDAGAPIFVQGQGGDSGSPDTLFDFPIQWSLGSKLSATNTDAPDGNPILVIANRHFLIKGTRSGPESVVIDGRDGTSALTDETLLKMRARRGFTLGHPKAAAILEKLA